MFIRFKRRERVSVSTKPWKARRRTGKFVLTAVLVRSERRDGKPRQKVVAYLASIAKEHVEEVPYRRDFWDQVDARLNSLELDPVQRQEVEASLVVVVPRPTRKELAAARTDLAAIMRDIRRRWRRWASG
jgi:hypothetical protein